MEPAMCVQSMYIEGKACVDKSCVRKCSGLYVADQSCVNEGQRTGAKQ